MAHTVSNIANLVMIDGQTKNIRKLQEIYNFLKQLLKSPVDFQFVHNQKIEWLSKLIITLFEKGRGWNDPPLLEIDTSANLVIKSSQINSDFSYLDIW